MLAARRLRRNAIPNTFGLVLVMAIWISHGVAAQSVTNSIPATNGVAAQPDANLAPTNTETNSVAAQPDANSAPTNTETNSVAAQPDANLAPTNTKTNSVAAQPDANLAPTNTKTNSATPGTVSSSAPGSGLMLSVLVLMSIATTISVATSIYLYRWRVILLRDGRLLVPEQLGAWLLDTDKSLKVLHGGQQSLAFYLQDSVEKTTGTAVATHEMIDRLMQAYLTLQRALDDKDVELKRLREGYDLQIYRRFISRFLRTREALVDAQTQQSFGPDSFQQVRRLLDDALEDCGVERFEPVIGSDYRTAEGIADAPTMVSGARDDQAFQIAEVLEPGYRIMNGGKSEVVVPARVRIFAPNTE